MKNFGIGCFHFGISTKNSFKFNGNEFLENLKKSLSSLPNLTNLNIVIEDEFKKIEVLLESTTDISEEGYFPYYNNCEISFNLYIPFRIQAELCVITEKQLRTFTENFRVIINYGYYMPVVIVETIDSTKKENSPSQSIQIVREFLEKQINVKNSEIKFQSLGPSPFHCDFFLTEEKEEFFENELLKKNLIIQTGYDILEIFYNNEYFDDINDAFEYVQAILFNEFDFYYKFVQYRVEKIRNWSEIQDDLQKILDSQKTNGLKGLYEKNVKRQSLISDILTKTINFEGRQIFIEDLLHNQQKETFKDSDIHLAKDFIEIELKEKKQYPTKQVIDLVTFFENRRVKNMELTIVLVASILGGIIGSIITIFFGK